MAEDSKLSCQCLLDEIQKKYEELNTLYKVIGKISFLSFYRVDTLILFFKELDSKSIHKMFSRNRQRNRLLLTAFKNDNLLRITFKRPNDIEKFPDQILEIVEIETVK